MPDLLAVTEDEAPLCLRCSRPMIASTLTIKQQPFPVEWVMQITGLSGTDGHNDYGWGSDWKECRQVRLSIVAK
jgi:hypothetical protein